MQRYISVALALYLLSACTPEQTPLQNEKIAVTSPLPNSTVSAVVRVTGEARGPWYFEANFPVAILDSKGEVLAEWYAEAQDDWMTEDFVPFIAILEIHQEYQGTGTLLIENANASGVPENNTSIEIPLIVDTLLLSTQEKASIENYITEYIGELSPEPPVLGGTFMVTNIEWSKTMNEAIVDYEDGHIALQAKAIIGVYANGDIALDDFVVMTE